MDDKIAKNYKAFAQAIEAHDHLNPDHNAHGIGLSAFDMDRLGLEEGEHVFGSITVQCDGKTSGNFRVLCDGEHDDQPSEEEEVEQTIDARSTVSV